MKFSLKKFMVVMAAVISGALFTACGDSPEDSFEKWRAAVLDGDEEAASELLYIDPNGDGIGVKHYNAKVIASVKQNPATKARLESVSVDDEEDVDTDVVILTLAYEEDDENKESKLAMRNVDGVWKLDPYASMPYMNLFVKKDEKAEKTENAESGTSAYGAAGEKTTDESTRDTNLTGGNPNFEENTENVQIDFENE